MRGTTGNRSPPNRALWPDPFLSGLRYQALPSPIRQFGIRNGGQASTISQYIVQGRLFGKDDVRQHTEEVRLCTCPPANEIIHENFQESTALTSRSHFDHPAVHQSRRDAERAGESWTETDLLARPQSRFTRHAKSQRTRSGEILLYIHSHRTGHCSWPNTFRHLQ